MNATKSKSKKKSAPKAEAITETKAAKPTTETKGAKAKAKKTEPKPKRISALDAAAQVLAKADKPMSSQELITAMSEQKLWSSPKGKTPHATLYAAMTREINEKGKEARFAKVDRGMFAISEESK